jgi:hypothetical protein
MFRDIELLVTSSDGTVGHDEHPPAYVGYGELVAPAQSVIQSRARHASVKFGGSHTVTCDSGVAAPANTSATPDSLLSAKTILRAARLRDLLASVEEYRRASGPDRTWWRRDARHRLAEWRRLHQAPERVAFDAAVRRNKQGSAA